MHPVTQVHILNFPVFGRGLSLRHAADWSATDGDFNFPAFGRGLLLRRELHGFCVVAFEHFSDFG